MEKLSDGADRMSVAIHELGTARKQAGASGDWAQEAFAYRDLCLPAMHKLREVGDEMELYVAREYWPFPTYNDMLFYV